MGADRQSNSGPYVTRLGRAAAAGARRSRSAIAAAFLLMSLLSGGGAAAADDGPSDEETVLVGVGLVIGLAGTGDSAMDPEFIDASIVGVLKRAGAGAEGFTLLPRRWVVERTLAWLNRNRRLAKDFEASVASAVVWILIASVKLLSRRIARRDATFAILSQTLSAAAMATAPVDATFELPARLKQPVPWHSPGPPWQQSVVQ